jgi:uncharacterized membrane protein
MGLEQILIAALALLATYGIHTTRRLSMFDRVPAPASTPADGALRITRARLRHGEIDTAEYERIRTVLCG